MKRALFFYSLLFLCTPSMAFAAPQTFSQLVDLILSYVNPIVSILVSLALLIFFWGIIKYIYSPGGEGHAQGRTVMVWGSIALFVLVCLWGLVYTVRVSLLGV